MNAAGNKSYLPRLPKGYYRGQAYVHWILTMEQRATCWLCPKFYSTYREVLTHAAFRYGFACPIYCCMPDHIHLLWIGLSEACDQRNAMRYFRRQLKTPLDNLGVSFQNQAYDHVLREEELERDAVFDLAEYIARNPERKGIVPIDGYREYEFVGCVVPGYPELKVFQDDYWERFWLVSSHLRKHGLQKCSGT